MSESPSPEALLAAFAGGSDDATAVLDSDGQFVLFPDDGESFHDSLSVSVGDDLWDTFEQSVAERLCGAVERTVATGDRQTVTYELPDRDEQQFDAQLSPVGEADTESGPTHVLWCATEATAAPAQTERPDLLTRVLEVSPVGIVVVEPSGEITTANERATEILGLERGEITDRTYDHPEWHIFYEDGTPIPESEHPVTRVLETGEPVLGFEHWIELPDGSRRWLSSHSAPVLDDDGTVERVVVGLDDATALKRREERLQWMIENETLADVGGWELDLETETVEGTVGMRRLHGDDSYSQSFEELLEYYHPEDRAEIRAAAERCRDTGEGFELEVRRRTAEGTQRWVRLSGERVSDGDSPVIRGVVRDITVSKEREQRLTVMNRMLRHNIRNKLNVVLGHADRLGRELGRLDFPARLEAKQQELLAVLEEATNASETLQSEVELLEQLLREASGFRIEEARASAREIQTASEDLYSLAETARKFDRAVRQEPSTETVDVDDVVTEVWERYTERYETATLALDSTDATITGNRVAIRLAVEILVENAVEHTDTADPTVSLSVEETGDGRVRIRVDDDGPGIPHQEFEVLERGTETQIVHSSGLGLWTVQWLTRRLGGEFAVHDREEGRGTSVELLFTAAETAA